MNVEGEALHFAREALRERLERVRGYARTDKKESESIRAARDATIRTLESALTTLDGAVGLVYFEQPAKPRFACGHECHNQFPCGQCRKRNCKRIA